MRLITLTTDFGTQDWFVGVMKGVIMSLSPQAMCIDLTHDIPPGDVRAGAFALASSYAYFPRGTVHLAVVDPGVGTDRAAIAVATDSYLFVGPDNGVLSLAIQRETVRACHRLENPEFFRQPVSNTFHGRDIFAPIAAHLTRGVLLEEMGPPHPAPVQIEWPRPVFGLDRVTGVTVYVDRFGNFLTNLPGEEIVQRGGQPRVKVGRRILPLVSTFQGVAEGEPLAYIGSTGLIEIAVNGGSARQVLKLKLDQPVEVTWERAR